VSLLEQELFILPEDFEDTKGIIRIRKSKKDRQHNGQNKKEIRTNNDLQSITHKTKDRVTRTPVKTGGELRYSGRVSSSWSTGDTRRVTIITNPSIGHEWGKDKKVFRQVEHNFDYYLSLSSFSFDHRIFCLSFFGLPPWYLQTFNKNVDIRFSAHDAFLE